MCVSLTRDYKSRSSTLYANSVGPCQESRARQITTRLSMRFRRAVFRCSYIASSCTEDMTFGSVGGIKESRNEYVTRIYRQNWRRARISSVNQLFVHLRIIKTSARIIKIVLYEQHVNPFEEQSN